MSIHSHRDLQNNILQNLGFHSVKGNHCTRFANKSRPEDGIFVLYERPGLYSLAAADYTAATSFSLAFESEETVLRFGSFYDGKTRFEIEGITSHSSSPSSFLVREEKIKGRQFWNTGQHCRGIEFALFPAFLKQLKTIDPHASVLDSLSKNRTYHSLPPAIITNNTNRQPHPAYAGRLSAAVHGNTDRVHQAGGTPCTGCNAQRIFRQEKNHL